MAQAEMKRKPKATVIWNLDLKQERVAPEPSSCAECGMALSHPREFHPYAACLMMKGARAEGGGGDVVQANLDFVIQHAIEAATRDS